MEVRPRLDEWEVSLIIDAIESHSFYWRKDKNLNECKDYLLKKLKNLHAKQRFYMGIKD